MTIPKPSLSTAKQPWHQWEMERVFAELQSQAEGLSYVTARQRLRQFGANKLPRPRKVRQIGLSLLTNPLTYLLLCLAVIVQYLGGDGWALIAVGVINGSLGVGLAWWSGKTREVASLGRTERRHNLPSTEALVLRDGEEMPIPARDLVVGDVIVLQSGDRPSVDLRLFQAEELQVNQTNIGGEAVCLKQVEVELEPDLPALERSNIIYAGTEISEGKGLGVAITTGKFAYWQSSNLGQQTFSAMHSDLRKLRQIWLICMALGILAIAGLGFYHHLSLPNLVIITTVVAVSSYPQQLLRLATQAQLLGMKALAKQRLWVKLPPAIDALGRLTVITLILESDTALSIDNLAVAGISWRGLIRASESDANALGKVLGIEVNSYFEAPIERLRTWQAERQSVALIGKEPEDIPLLRQADVSISDRSCKKIIQDSASLILPREDFHYIPLAIAEGRSVFARLQRIFLLYFSSLATVLVLVLLAIATDTAVISLEILWVGAIIAPLVAFPLIVEPAAKNIMAQPAKRFQTILNSGNFYRWLLAVAVMTATVSVVFWLKYQGVASALAPARTMAFTTLVLSQAFQAVGLYRRSLIKNLPMLVTLGIVAIAQILIVQVNILGELLGTVPLNSIEWAIAGLAATSIFWFQELFATN